MKIVYRKAFKWSNIKKVIKAKIIYDSLLGNNYTQDEFDKFTENLEVSD